ncbi:unnamed protein product [Auanema sp. JU1783]|nr:unnamed protein product [Auanema sp. JU1783]
MMGLSNFRQGGEWIYRISLIVLAILCGFAWYQRTINMWALKNIGDTFLTKEIGSRQIVLGAFFRPLNEQNIQGKYAVIHFVGDTRMEHPVYCFTKKPDNTYLVSHAQVERIHKGKRAANDICSWSGHIAECEVDPSSNDFRIGATPQFEDSMLVVPEKPLEIPRQDLVVCVAPMYTYTDWEIMLVGIETWLALGATKIVVPIQSASSSTYRILKEYEKKGHVIIRQWPKWPILSDTNPNGLVLSRGIEESHVNCLFFVKPWADLVVFTDIDDMLLPPDLNNVKPGVNLEILRNLFAEHPQAGSLLFEHRDTQFQLLPQDARFNLKSFNFDFLKHTKSKMNCNVWRMKTRVVINASRVDSVNMHETGIHRFGFVQTRVPCRQAHFYHLRHSHSNVPSPVPIDTSALREILNKQWQNRLEETFSSFKEVALNKSSTESFEDFDRCMGAINEEHWTMHVSRCLTPHVCFSRLKREVDCVASHATFNFYRSGDGYVMQVSSAELKPSLANCEAPVPPFSEGNHYFAP